MFATAAAVVLSYQDLFNSVWEDEIDTDGTFMIMDTQLGVNREAEYWNSGIMESWVVYNRLLALFVRIFSGSQEEYIGCV
jgi:hypothetical protein